MTKEEEKIEVDEKRFKAILKNFDVKKLSDSYKTTDEEIIDKIRFYMADELSYDDDIENDELVTLIERDIRLHMRGHKQSEALPALVYVLSKKDAYNYGKKRIADLKKLFSVDPKKAINDGIRDAACDVNGKIIYKEGATFNKGDYPENRYLYEIQLIGNRLDIPNGEKKTISITVYDDDLDLFNSIEAGKWYNAKLILNDDEKSTMLVGGISSLTEFKETEPEEEIMLINLKKKKGLIYDSLLSVHLIELSDLKEYYDKFKDEKGRMPIERFIISVVDVVNINQSKNTMFISDSSLDTEDPPITAFDNRADKSLRFGPRSKILIVGSIAKDTRMTDSERYTINITEIKIIPKELGGYFYPEKIEKSKDIKIEIPKRKTKKEEPEEEDVDADELIEEDLRKEYKKETGKNAKYRGKETRAYKDWLKKKNLKLEEDESDEDTDENEVELKKSYDKNLISEEIQDGIVSAIYKLDSGSFEEILEETGLNRNEAYDASFQDLIKREIIKKNNGGYEV